MSTNQPDADVIVVGSGVAGLATALHLAPHRRVLVVSSAGLDSGSTAWAQGGIAAALGSGDSPGHHAADTVSAGAGLCLSDIVRQVTMAAPSVIDELKQLGFSPDRSPDGALRLGREGGHGRHRIVHAGGDATGGALSRALAAALDRSAAQVLTGNTVTDLLTVSRPGNEPPVVCGVRLETGDHITARAVVLATGGVGGLFSRSTNPPEVTGVGLALALRAGAALADLEFVQFHPTGLVTDLASPTYQVPLVTEALRGAGARLVTADGALIMSGHHPMGDLAPRDVVARRIDTVMREAASPYPAVFLDATDLGADLPSCFPTVTAACRAVGIDPVTDVIPIAPVQHFLCGGVATDTWSATDLEGLYAVGEVAATGLHGANRLASNSLLEALVMSRRLAERLSSRLPAATGAPDAVKVRSRPDANSLAKVRRILDHAAGIRRNADTLAAASQALAAIMARRTRAGEATDDCLAALGIVAAATGRTESRGCHYRDDYPRISSSWRRRQLIRLIDGTAVIAGSRPLPEAA